MASTSPRPATRRRCTLETRHVEALRETVDRLRDEVAELRAARKRLVLSADDERRRIERDLHDGVQQNLIALAVDLQLAGKSVELDPPSTKAHLDQLSRALQQVLDETAELARQIYPTIPDAGGLAATLRSAAAGVGVAASVEVAHGLTYPPEVAWTVYLCWLEALEHAAGEGQATVTVREEEEALVFEVVADVTDATFDPLRDRVEALGGTLAVQSEPGRGTRISGSLPLSR